VRLVWNLEAERPRGLEVDCQFEFDRLFHRQVGGLGALQNLAAWRANHHHVGVAPPARAGLSCSLLKTAAERAGDRDQDASSDEAGNQIADPSGERDTENAQQPAGDSGSYDAEYNVHQKPHLAFHELLGEPASDSANDDGCDPTDLVLFHWCFLLAGRLSINHISIRDPQKAPVAAGWRRGKSRARRDPSS
jgi:hypothetical protein